MFQVKRSLILLASVLLLPYAVLGATNCVSTQCELPSSGLDNEIPSKDTTQGWVPSASGMSAIKCLNSVGPNGNPAGSKYFIAAVIGNSNPATKAKGTILVSGDGQIVIGSFQPNSQPSPNSPVVGLGIQGILGNSLATQNGQYAFYVEACPSGATLDSGLCSDWSNIGTNQTLAYPTSVFSAPVNPGDATISSIVLRTSVPGADANNVSQITNLEIDDLITPANKQLNLTLGWPGNNATVPLDNSDYSPQYIPNTKYQYKGQVTYPGGINVPTSGQQTEGPFWTTPTQPGTIQTVTATHCSAQLTVNNSVSSALTNPPYTFYQACLDQSGGCGNSPQQVSGASFNNTATLNYTNLTPGITYAVTATALSGNTGAATGWNNSQTQSGTVTTQSWGTPAFGIQNVQTTQADFTDTGINLGSGNAWQVVLDGVGLAGAQYNGTGNPPSPMTITGLTPNTKHTVQIKLTDTSGGCSTTLPLTPVGFTTKAADPTGFTMSAASPYALSAGWSDSLNLAVNTAYAVQYCTNLAMTTGCNTVSTAKGALTATLSTGVNPNTNYYAQVTALTVGGGQNSNPAPSTAFGPVTTPSDIKSITLNPPTASVITGPPATTFSARVTDPSGNVIPGQAVTWTIAGTSTGNGTLSTGSGGSASSTNFTGTLPGIVYLTASLSGYSSVNSTITVQAAGPIVDSLSFAPSPDSKGGTATVVRA